MLYSIWSLTCLLYTSYDIKADYPDVINEPMYRDAMDIASDVLGAYTSGEVSEIYLAYTCFMNTAVSYTHLDVYKRQCSDHRQYGCVYYGQERKTLCELYLCDIHVYTVLQPVRSVKMCIRDRHRISLTGFTLRM